MLGTYNGNVIRFSPAKQTFRIYPKGSAKGISGELIRYIYRDKYEDIWIGTYYGELNKYDRKTDSFIKYDLDINKNNPSANFVRVIYEDKDGILWFGANGNGGLTSYNRKENKFSRYSSLDNTTTKISGDDILSICEDKNGFLWIGNYSYGLNRFDKASKKFKHYFSEADDQNSLPDNTIPELFIDSHGNVWGKA